MGGYILSSKLNETAFAVLDLITDLSVNLLQINTWNTHSYVTCIWAQIRLQQLSH